MIIDAHVHLGGKITEKNLIAVMDNNEIEISIVQPLPYVINMINAHDRIAALVQKYPGRIFGMANINSRIGEDDYEKEASRCIKELKFVGIKFNPMEYSLSPLSKEAEIAFETANELRVSIMVHTGPGVPFALPALCIPRAHQYPNLNIILAHAGFGIYTSEAHVAAKECQNIFLETSWCPGYEIENLVKDIGSDKIMFGSDGVTNLPAEIAKYKALNLTNEELDRCLFRTAKEVFRLKT